MKRILTLTLVLALLLCGCGANAEPTTIPTEATTEATTEPTTVPTTEPPPVYTNPLTGVVIDAPLTTRVFGVSIGNTKDALPHYGVSKADVLFETYVNGLTTRRFALYSDLSQVEAIGGSRSMRMPFTDMALGYDAVAVYAGGSSLVIGDLKESGVDGIISQQWGTEYHWREEGKPYTHALMVNGQGVVDYAVELGYEITQAEDRDYGFRFTDTPAPAEGETAEIVTIGMEFSGRVKETIMTYNPDLNGYTMTQYGIEMVDGYYNVPEVFRNVFVLLGEAYNNDIYHMTKTLGDGDGWFACDGKLIPIKWHRATDNDPFTFTTLSGDTLEQGVGSSYIALASLKSTVTAEPFPAETVPDETSAE